MRYKKKRIYLSPPYLNDEEISSVNKAIKSNWIAPLGPYVDKFENEILNYIKIKHAIAVSSGTAALHLAMKVLNIKRGDYIFCSDLTFVASANVISYVNATPIFIDSNFTSWNMCDKSLKRAFKKFHPKAVIVTNIYGQSAEYDKIKRVCNQENVPIIEDAAESLGAEYMDKKSGSFGDLSIISFNGNKIITTSGGGMLLSNNKNFINKAYKLATQSKEKEIFYEHKEIGYNYRMSNILCAIGVAQFKKLDVYVKKTRNIFKNYIKLIGENKNIEFMPEVRLGRSTNWLTAILLKNKNFNEIKKLIQEFDSENIEVRPIWKPMHLQPLYKNCHFFKVEEKAVSKYIFNHGLCLPSGISLNQYDQGKIINILYKNTKR